MSSSNRNRQSPITSDSDPITGLPEPGSSGGSGASATKPKSRTERRAELFEQRRRDRKKAPEKLKRDRMVSKVILGGLAAILVGGLVWGIVAAVRDQQLNQRPDGVQTFSYVGGEHTTETVDYPESPPVGGAHDAFWQTCAFYAEPIRSENAVHSLEHGAVWITYRPDVGEDVIDQLRDRTDGDSYMLVSPFEDQESPLVLTAWNNQLEVDSLDDNRVDQFIRYFRQGPQTPEPGATCLNGTTATVG
jgi:hypothetical protein